MWYTAGLDYLPGAWFIPMDFLEEVKPMPTSNFKLWEICDTVEP